MTTFLQIILPVVCFVSIMAMTVLFFRRFLAHYHTADPDTLDAVLYTLIGMCIAAQTAMGADSVYDYIDPHILFWLRTTLGIVAGGALYLKAYRDKGRGTP